MYKSDWKNHHIEGFAYAAQRRGIDSYFSCDLISHIYTHSSGGELWMGGFIEDVSLDAENFNYIFCLYPLGTYEVESDTVVEQIHAYDSSDQETDIFVSVGEKVAGLVSGGKKVLVHCQAGLNRSGTVSALALINLGFTPKDALALLRDKRSPLVLCNKTFEDFILSR